MPTLLWSQGNVLLDVVEDTSRKQRIMKICKHIYNLLNPEHDQSLRVTKIQDQNQTSTVLWSVVIFKQA